jgi:hypothetical protein
MLLSAQLCSVWAGSAFCVCVRASALPAPGLFFCAASPGIFGKADTFGLLAKVVCAEYFGALRFPIRQPYRVGENCMNATLGAASALILLASVATATAQNLPGKYSVQGTNLDGSLYSGTAEIVATSETTCRIVWHTGSTTSSGICMRNGASFAAGYVLGESVGLVVYEMMADGSLKGAWTIAEEEGVGYETLTPQR